MGDWRKLIGKDDPQIIEVGANDGQDTKRLLAEFPECRIWAFEPEPRAIEVFRKNIQDKRANLIEEAVGARRDRLPWFASHGKVPGECGVGPEAMEDWHLSGSVKSPTGHLGKPDWCSWRQEGYVTCTALDDIGFYGGASFDLLWIDAQGNEREVLQGAKSHLTRTRYVYTEFYDQHFNHQGFDCETLYEGQADLVQLICTLGSDWKLLGFYEGGNALFGNRKLCQST